MRRRPFLGLATLLAAFGCMRNTYTTGLPPGGATHIENAPFFLFGLAGDAQIRLDELCPDGVAWFQNRMSMDNGLVSYFTLGLYTPRTVEVRCAGGTAFRLRDDPSAGGSWITEIGPEPLSADSSERDRR